MWFQLVLFFTPLINAKRREVIPYLMFKVSCLLSELDILLHQMFHSSWWPMIFCTINRKHVSEHSRDLWSGLYSFQQITSGPVCNLQNSAAIDGPAGGSSMYETTVEEQSFTTRGRTGPSQEPVKPAFIMMLCEHQLCFHPADWEKSLEKIQPFVTTF